MGTTVTPPLGAATLVENPIGAAMRKPNRHRAVLPALHWQDAPAAVLAEALEARTALFSATGASGSGKTVWAEQLDEAARAWSRTHADRWRVVHVSATKHDHQVPFALARRIIVTAGGARPDPDAETDPDSDAAINGTANDCRRALTKGLSSRRRLLLIIDDAQWIDDASLQVLRAVVSQHWPTGLCLVLAGRTPRTPQTSEIIATAARHPWGAKRRIDFLPLDPSQARTYISRVHDLELSLALATRLTAVSRGLPLLLDHVLASLHSVWQRRQAAERVQRPRFDEDITDALIAEAMPALESPIDEHVQRLRPGARAAVEIASVLDAPLSESAFAQLDGALDAGASPAQAIADGVLVAAGRSGRRGADATVEGYVVHHDLLAEEIAKSLSARRRARILRAAAEVLPASDAESRYRALVWALEAHGIAGTAPAEPTLERLRAVVTESAERRLVERVLGIMQLAIDAARRPAPRIAEGLVLELYTLAMALSALPRLLPFVPTLEAMPPSPLRDLALLHMREFRGDYAWAREFGARMLSELPAQLCGTGGGRFRSAAPAEQTALLEALHIRAHVLLILGMMAPQATLRSDFGFAPLRQARELALQLAALPAARWAAVDRRLRWLPSASDIVLRATGLIFYGASTAGDFELAHLEYVTLAQRIEAAPERTATLFDAYVIRAGVHASQGRIALAYNDLECTQAMLAAGVAGWGEGTGRTMFLYCAYLLGKSTEIPAIVQESSATILDAMDAVSRPSFYALLAVIAAEAGNGAGWQASAQLMEQTRTTDYDIFGAEFEMWAQVAYARMTDDPAAQLAVFAADGEFSERLLRSQNIFAFKVDALAALGRAEAADRELARLRALRSPAYEGVHGSLDWLEGRVQEAYGHTREAIRAYVAAANSVGHDSAFPVATARAAADAGRLMLDVGSDLRRARRYLRSALDTYTRLNMVPAAVRIGGLLDRSRAGVDSALGPIEHRRAEVMSSVPGAEHLTGRERDVVLLAAQGSSNAEIAARYGISVSTVGFHMTNVLGKLGMASRRELHDPRVAAELRLVSVLPPRRGSARLTRRETEVMRLAQADRTNAEIADELGVSYRTVAFHIENILRKLGLSSRRQLAAL
ncbi:LuxR C-terminal-related transcriptional regulator [Leucobacter sp. gxy201]|uniref:helix-turn-helix transcriptional regulator n=1 Tax=Leucobacter sp. gxy201 TaxID=2957200 RepID=UPI003DA16594